MAFIESKKKNTFKEVGDFTMYVQKMIRLKMYSKIRNNNNLQVTVPCSA